MQAIQYFLEPQNPGARRNIWTIGRIINGYKYPEFQRHARKHSALTALANLRVQDEQIAKAACQKPFWWPNNL